MHTHVDSYAKTHLWSFFCISRMVFEFNVHLVLGTIVFILKLVFLTVACSLKRYQCTFFGSGKKKDRLPQYIFLIWQDNIVQIICMPQKNKKKKGNKKVWHCPDEKPYNGGLGSLLECHTDGCPKGCTYPFLFLFPAAILYAVLQANNVGLLCSVLFVPFLLSPYIPASYLHMQ